MFGPWNLFSETEMVNEHFQLLTKKSPPLPSLNLRRTETARGVCVCVCVCVCEHAQYNTVSFLGTESTFRSFHSFGLKLQMGGGDKQSTIFSSHDLLPTGFHCSFSANVTSWVHDAEQS